MSEKTASVIQKAMQERKRAQFGRALKRLEQAIASHPDELDLYLEAIDTAIEGGELKQATDLLKTVQEKFTRERDRVSQFVREKLQTVHDPSLARCVVEHAVKRRDLETALGLLADVPDHTIRELLNRARTKAQSLKSAERGGYTLRGETVVNELTNAVLSVRIGNLNEAMATFVKVVEEKPAEHHALETFLASLATANAKSGPVRFARGCAMRSGGNEIDAVHLFVEAARVEPACAPECAEKLQSMLEHAQHPGKIRRALAETQLINGNVDDAAASLRQYLAENPENGREVIMLLRPFIDPANGINACTWLAVEQALAIAQSSIALEILRPLQARGHGGELYAWLEEHPEAASSSVDVMMLHGSLAIEEKQFEHAAALLGKVCATSPQDVHAVLGIIDRHRNAHASLEALYQKHAPEDETEEAPAPADGDDGFQNFESNEFRLDSAAPVSTHSPKEKTRPRFNSSPFSTAEAPAEEQSTTAQRPFVDARELSFEDDGSVHRAGEGSSMFELTESHVDNVGQKLYETGAAAFFHIDGTEAVNEEAQPSDSVPATGAAHAPAQDDPAHHENAHVAPAPVAARKPDVAPPQAAEPFAARYQRFSRGELSNAAVLVLLEEAVSEGHVDELHELLYFEPETATEYFARYYYQAEYHILCNRPLQALEILARLDTPDLDDEHRRRVWYKIAVSQRMVHNYAGAAATLERLVQRFPEREEFARLKRRNHEQFIAEQSMAATTLEKTSSLD